MAVKTGVQADVKIGSGATSMGLVMSATVDITIDEEDVTCFDPGGTLDNYGESAPTIRRVSGTIDGNVDYADAAQKEWIDEVVSGSTMIIEDLTLYPYGTSFGLQGNAIPKISLSMSGSSVSKFSFPFTGTGKWIVVTA